MNDAEPAGAACSGTATDEDEVFDKGENCMQGRKLIAMIALVVLGGAAWYAFRPERLFIDQIVNEGVPTATSTPGQPNTLYSGRFHDGSHKTSGNATIFRLSDGSRVLRLSEFQTSNGPDLQL